MNWILRFVIVTFFWAGFTFLILVGMWSIFSVRKMQREQAEGLLLIKTLGDRIKLSERIEVIVEKQKQEESKDV